jgi:hypothetical protein
MARPSKNTAEFFSHTVAHSKTMFKLEAKYGNDGYAFFFKLLEMLGAADNHFLDLSNEGDWEYFAIRMKVDEDICAKIINDLVTWDKLDKELWTERKVIWYQKFVDGLSTLYANRRRELPQKPCFYNENPEPVEVSTVETTQSKVKYSKVKESKENTIACARACEDENSESETVPQPQEEIQIPTQHPLEAKTENEQKASCAPAEVLAVEKSIAEWFGFTEQNNFDKIRTIGQFCKTLNHRGRLDYFRSQFADYKRYKDASGDKHHTFYNFLGKAETHYEDGGWNADNWGKKFSKLGKPPAAPPPTYKSKASKISSPSDKL